MRHTRMIARTAAVAACAALLVPTAAYTADRLHDARHRPKTDLPVAEEVEAPVTPDALPAQVPETPADPGELIIYGMASDTACKLVSGGAPEDLVYQEEGPWGGKYHSEQSELRGISPVGLIRIGDPESYAYHYIVPDAVETEAFATDDGTAWLTRRGMGFDYLTVAFSGTPYLTAYYVRGMTDEEVRTFADGQTLVPLAEGETEDVWYWYPEQFEAERAQAQAAREQDMIVEAAAARFNREEVFLIYPGDVVNAYDNNTLVPRGGLTVSFTEAWLQSGFEGITTDEIGLPEDLGSLLSGDGTLHSLRRMCRDDTLEVTDEQTVRQYVLVTDVLAANTGEAPQEITFTNALFSLSDTGGIIEQYADTQAGILVSHEPDLMSEGGFFSFDTSHAHDKNSVTLAPGESAAVRLAFVIDEDWVGNCYMKLCFENDTDTYLDAGCPVLDLCGLMPES
ncbi:MAG: hypothetical protein IJ055_07095 [Oscillospiraceae bacterium]|nr:hypothetical protein [Oscillospiraceae bacterium]